VAGIENALFGLRTDGSARRGTRSVDFRDTDSLVEVGSDWRIRVYERTEEPDPNASLSADFDGAGRL